MDLIFQARFKFSELNHYLLQMLALERQQTHQLIHISHTFLSHYQKKPSRSCKRLNTTHHKNRPLWFFSLNWYQLPLSESNHVPFKAILAFQFDSAKKKKSEGESSCLDLQHDVKLRNLNHSKLKENVLHDKLMWRDVTWSMNIPLLP